MGKKIWYSSPLNLYWREVYRNQKGFTPYLSDDQIYNVLKHKNARIGLTSKTGDNRESFLIGLEMWWQDYNKNLLHVFFLDRQLRDYLEAMLTCDVFQNVLLREFPGSRLTEKKAELTRMSRWASPPRRPDLYS